MVATDDLAHKPIRRVALGLGYLGRCDQQLKLEHPTEVEQDLEVVLRQPVCFIEKKESQRAMRPLRALS